MGWAAAAGLLQAGTPRCSWDEPRGDQSVAAPGAGWRGQSGAHCSGALGAAERSRVAWKGLAASPRSVRGAAPGSSRGDRLLPASALRVVAAGAALRVGRSRPPRRLPPAPARPPFAFAFAAFSFLNFRLIRFRRGPGPLHSAASAARPRSASRSRPWPPQAGLSRAADCERPRAPPHAPVRSRVALSCLLFGVTLGRSASALPVSGRACPGPISSVPCPALAFVSCHGIPSGADRVLCCSWVGGAPGPVCAWVAAPGCEGGGCDAAGGVRHTCGSPCVGGG